jgi:hypothetical protein
MASVPHPNPRVYPQPSDLTAKLFPLIAYAIAQQHSRQWIGAISAILARTEVPRG